MLTLNYHSSNTLTRKESIKKISIISNWRFQLLSLIRLVVEPLDDSKYVEYAKALPEKKRPVVSKASSMHDAVLSSMTVRLHTPYWMLHSGDCTHHIVFEQIR